MKTIQCKFVDPNLNEADREVLLPKRQSALASGFDVASAHKDEIVLAPFERRLINTGVAIALPAGFEAQVRTRSGLAGKFGVIVLNSPGTIDADYRGEIKVILANLSNEPFSVTFGMRIAQLVIAPVVMPELHVVLSLDESARAEGGFGSTGLYNTHV